MKIDRLQVNYIIDGKNSVIPSKRFYEQVEEDEFQHIHFEVEVKNHQVKSKVSDSMEYAVKNLQKALPENIRIACCQSCQHGHFNPFGDMDNEIFCLKEETLHKREDVVKIFSEQNESIGRRSRRLLDYCEEYKPISRIEKYTYNDWDI